MIRDLRFEKGPRASPLSGTAWDFYEQQLEAQQATAEADHFYAQITSSAHVGVTELVPHVTLVLPDAAMRLAHRPADEGGCEVEQALYGIVRAGNHGFGLATAYSTAQFRRSVLKGKDKERPRPGRSYITQINMDPHGDSETKLVAPLVPNTPAVVLGGPGRLVPELSDEGLLLMINAKQTPQMRVPEIRLTLLGRKLGKIPFQLITATRPLLVRPRNDSPVDEVGTWAPTPSYVKRKLKIH